MYFCTTKDEALIVHAGGFFSYNTLSTFVYLISFVSLVYFLFFAITELLLISGRITGLT